MNRVMGLLFSEGVAWVGYVDESGSTGREMPLNVTSLEMLNRRRSLIREKFCSIRDDYLLFRNYLIY